ncbi:putative spermidine/putrescine transport system substrate-binding protein [Mycetocola sp. BIGb0189]|uniref:ABC transporter substrate-binding protein n=1 Tax=Mycetocola sp. BIGb0189 TaxID=2940604 RepID=UPI002167ED3A|nr:ABC transporter substrate-binding protein [Mycetocola sp. BIGb0189]MCS4276556.1 putative spermidine/putrescine transport system substrate-binding protein [Mycetocola sp. BIGb0189]
MSRSIRLVSAIALLTVAGLGLAGCSASASSSDNAASAKASKAESLKDFGTLDELAAAAKAEGKLNVIALPRDWANYGNIIDAFSKKYGIKVNELQPNGSSADEIAAAKNNKGLDTAPDVFNIGDTIANSSEKYLAVYRNQAWDEVDPSLKDADGHFIAGEGGFLSIGYDSAKVPEPKTFNDLLGSDYKGLAISGDPTKNAPGLAAVGLATLQEGGTLDNFQPGIDFFGKLNKAGNLISVQPSSATVVSGETKLIISYDYSNVAYGRDLPTWKVTIPEGTGYGSFLYQAINKDAPHPAAARLWQEFLYQADQQNQWIKSGARSPIEVALVKAGTVDKAALAGLPAAPAKYVIPTIEQSKKAGELVATNWAPAVG